MKGQHLFLNMVGFSDLTQPHHYSGLNDLKEGMLNNTPTQLTDQN